MPGRRVLQVSDRSANSHRVGSPLACAVRRVRLDKVLPEFTIAGRGMGHLMNHYDDTQSDRVDPCENQKDPSSRAQTSLITIDVRCPICAPETSATIGVQENADHPGRDPGDP